MNSWNSLSSVFGVFFSYNAHLTDERPSDKMVQFDALYPSR